MFEDSINILRLHGNEKNILQAEDNVVKLPRTGIFICTEGWVNVELDETEYHLVRGGMIVYFAYSSLHISNHSTFLTGLLIGADLETIQPLLYNISDFNAIFTIKDNPHTLLDADRTNRLISYAELIENTMERLKGLENVKGDPSRLPAKEILLQQRHMLGQAFMLEIISCFDKARNNFSVDNRRDDVLKQFMTKLYQNYRKEHEVAFYAKDQCLTCRYFSAVIKARSGQSPSVWISTALLAEAKQLLRTSSMSIHDISEYLYFPNQSYFGKWFKAHTGISPIEYKKGKPVTKHTDEELAKFIPISKMQ